MSTKPNPAQTPPVLTLHRMGTTYILRITDVADSALAIHLAKGLEAENLIVVTPTDTKAFHFGDSGTSGTLEGEQEASTLGEEIEPDEETFQEEAEGEDPQELAYRLGQLGEETGSSRGSTRSSTQTNPRDSRDKRSTNIPGTRTTRRTAVKNKELDEDALPPASQDAKVVGRRGNMKVVRRANRTPSTAGTNSICRRCEGNGRVAIALESGAATEGNCPVCKGTGQMTLFGMRPTKVRG
jgi:hypothetical protein